MMRKDIPWPGPDGYSPDLADAHRGIIGTAHRSFWQSYLPESCLMRENISFPALPQAFFS